MPGSSFSLEFAYSRDLIGAQGGNGGHRYGHDRDRLANSIKNFQNGPLFSAIWMRNKVNENSDITLFQLCFGDIAG